MRDAVLPGEPGAALFAERGHERAELRMHRTAVIALVVVLEDHFPVRAHVVDELRAAANIRERIAAEHAPPSRAARRDAAASSDRFRKMNPPQVSSATGTSENFSFGQAASNCTKARRAASRRGCSSRRDTGRRRRAAGSSARPPATADRAAAPRGPAGCRGAGRRCRRRERLVAPRITITLSPATSTSRQSPVPAAVPCGRRRTTGVERSSRSSAKTSGCIEMRGKRRLHLSGPNRPVLGLPCSPRSDRGSRPDRRAVEEPAAAGTARPRVRPAADHPRDQSTGAGADAEAMAAETGRDQKPSMPARAR